MTANDIQQRLQQKQKEITQQLETADGKGKFRTDTWDREQGGGGITMTLRDGDAIEKSGVNFSYVHGAMSDEMAKALKVEGESTFAATGISSIIHPVNPFVPIIHMNVRYFELTSGKCWFGGGIDLTPHYIFPEDAKGFHLSLKEVCDQFHPEFYPEFNRWAADYFFLSHRNETRGVGGIFFDRQIPGERLEKEKWVDFILALSDLYPKIYIRLMNKYRDKSFTDEQKQWQELRRSRYVEFNLVHDRGTKFGLVSGGRTESILVSMPPTARWEYMHQPEEDSMEAETLNLLKKDIDWINYGEEK